MGTRTNGRQKLSKTSQKLDAVAKARQAFVLARTTLELRLREQMKTELTNLQTQVDIAVRYAIDAGESKASILRAMGTKNFGTLQESLERTQGVSEIVGDDPFDNVYYLIGNALTVNYKNYGPSKFNGHATFEVKTWDDGTVFLISQSPLWNEDYSVRNDAVAALDGKTDGWYYDEVIEWIANNS